MTVKLPMNDTKFETLVVDITTLINTFIEESAEESDETIDLDETPVQLEVLSKVVGTYVHLFQMGHEMYDEPGFVTEAMKFVVDVALNSYNSLPCACSRCVADRDSPNLSPSTRGYRMQ